MDKLVRFEYKDIKTLLTQWGRWSKTSQDIAGIGYKPLSIYTQSKGGEGSSYEFDTIMIEIDKAMQWLKASNHFDYRMLKLKYKYGFSFNRIADKLTKELPQYRKNGKKMHNNTAQNYVELAENTLLIYLQNIPCKSERYVI